MISKLDVIEDNRIQAILLKETFNSLKEKGLIEWGYNPKQEGASPFADGGSLNILTAEGFEERMKTTTLKYHSILIHLTLSGFTYCYERNRLKKQDENLDRQTESILATNESVRETNTSTLKNFSFQKWLTISNLVVSAGAVIISCIALFKDNSKEIKEQNKILEKQVYLIDSIQQKFKLIPSKYTTTEKETSKSSTSILIDTPKKTKQ